MKEIVEKFEFDMLVCAKNESKRKYFKLINDFNQMKSDLSQILSTVDVEILLNAIEKARENMFNASKNRLINKFQLLKTKKSASNNKNTEMQTNHVKNAVLDLTNAPIPDNQKSLLELGPNFVPSTKRIPFMDIISTSECSALKLEYNGNIESAQTLRKDVLRVWTKRKFSDFPTQSNQRNP